MKKEILFKSAIGLFFCSFILSSCGTKQIKSKSEEKENEGVEYKKTNNKADLNDACDIYAKNPEWLTHSLESSKKWQVPIFVMLAIIHQESSFVSNARPLNPNKNSKKKYASSAYGYAQALDGTWKEYKQQVGKKVAKRDEFNHAVDFIGWYVFKAHKRNKISKWAADSVYLNYHEGMGGYSRGTHLKKKWLLKVSKKVKSRAVKYARQLKSCGIPLYLKKGSKSPKITIKGKKPSPIKRINIKKIIEGEIEEKVKKEAAKYENLWF